MHIPDTIISFIFIIFIFSAVASAAMEYFNKIRKKRGKFLLSCLSQNLKDEFINQIDFSLLIYSHPLVAGLKEDKDSLPSYISSSVFATALIQVVTDYKRTFSFNFEDEDVEQTPTTPTAEPKNPDALNDFIIAVNSLKPSSVKTLFESFITDAKNYEELKKNIVVWYEHYMERISGWFKNDTTKWMFRISVIIVIVFNVDTLNIVRSLNENSALNSYITASAQNYVEQNKNKTFDSVDVKQARELINLTDTIGVPIGYDFEYNKDAWFMPSTNVFCSISKQAEKDGGFLMLILGWLISAIAISKGAPFWFDLLSKAVNLRSAGKKPSENK